MTERLYAKAEGAPNAEAQILGIYGEIEQMGANDSERSAIMAILESLRAGLISAVEAVAKALRIKNEKQDYH